MGEGRMYAVHRQDEDVIAHAGCFHCGAATSACIPLDEFAEALRHDFAVECEDCSKASGTFYTGVRLRVVGADDHLPVINPGVLRLVKWLNANGFQTVDSGDGETHDYGCDRGSPYVVIVSHDGETDADDVYASLVELMGVVPDAVLIQYNYSPRDCHAFVDVMGLRDDMIEWGDER